RALIGSFALLGLRDLPVFAAPVDDSGWSIEGPLELEASRMELSNGQLVGEGEVRAWLEGVEISAVRFTLDREGDSLVLEDGRWERADGVVQFERLQLQLEDPGAVVVRGRFLGDRGAPVASGARWTWDGENRWTGQEVRYTSCTCDPPPWEVSARRVDVLDEEVATFRGGWLELCGQRLLPVPGGRVPLTDRQSGLLVPRIGYGQDGLVAGVPAYVVLGSRADVTLEPEWRDLRGLRALGEARLALASDEGVELQAAAGHDHLSEEWRGALDWWHAWTPGDLRTAWEGQWSTDTAYASDYADDYFGRSAPWYESLGVIGWKGLRLETDTFQGDEPVGQRLFGAVGSVPSLAVGPLLLAGETRVDLAGEGEDPWSVGPTRERLRAETRARWTGDLGWLRTSAEVRARWTRWASGEPWLEDGVRARVLVPAWADHGSFRHLLDLGLEAQAHELRGVSEQVLPSDVPWEPWSVGPVAQSRWLSTAGVPVSAEVSLPWTEAGFRPQGSLRAQWEDWAVRGQAESGLQEGWVDWSGDVLGAGLGAVRFGDQHQATGDIRWSLPGALREWTPGWSGQLDMDEREFLTHGPRLQFSSRCGCLVANAGATWSEDRPVPDLFLTVEVP
ncbi:MAG: hypothetical protein QGG40_07325, partial [Myxococcota bacterium]|nr:hypothetical protein [Myxococcota bacterium]